MSIAHFGCWNEYNNILIIKKILEQIIKENLSFLSIGGDNYYQPNNIFFDKNRISLGFNLLPQNITKYIIFGNHDIEDYESLKYQVQLNSPNIILYNGPIFKKLDEIIIIYIDTTIYKLKPDDEIPKSYKLLSFSNNIKTVKDFIDKQETVVRKFINSSKYKKIIFIGHHPIFGAKFKKNKDKIYLLENLRNFIFSFNYPDIIYIGSHIHNYQKGVVTFNNKNILQYITGTGGAFLDKIPIENNFNEDNTTYNIINKSKKHGYILISNINIIFKQIKQF